MANNFTAKLGYSASFGTLAFRSRLEYRNADGRVNIVPKFCELRSSNHGDYVAYLCIYTCVKKMEICYIPPNGRVPGFLLVFYSNYMHRF